MPTGRKKSEATQQREAAADAKTHARLLKQVRKLNSNSASSNPSVRSSNLSIEALQAHMTAQAEGLRRRRAHDRANNRRALHADRRRNAVRNYRPTWHTECWKPCREADAWVQRASDADASACEAAACNDLLAIRMRAGLRKGEPKSLLAIMEHAPTIIQPQWHPADHTSTFGRPHTAMNSASYYHGLVRHLGREVDAVRADYTAMPERVVSERNAKGDVGRDLNEWETEHCEIWSLASVRAA